MMRHRHHPYSPTEPKRSPLHQHGGGENNHHPVGEEDHHHYGTTSSSPSFQQLTPPPVLHKAKRSQIDLSLRSSSETSHHQHPELIDTIQNLRIQRNVLLILCLILTIAMTILIIQIRTDDTTNGDGLMSNNRHQSSANNNLCAISMGKYRGPVYTSSQSGTVGVPKCLLESRWFKIAQHKVKLPNSDNVIDDWLMIDYHDRINVVVEYSDDENTGKSKERNFLVFEQSKYALDGRQSLAIVGGIIEPGEEPEHAARREVNEEMGLSCKVFYPLGRWRTDVNRGMGWVNSFLATNCHKVIQKPQAVLGVGEEEEEEEEEVGAPDTEKQNIKSLTLSEMKIAVAKGEFLEVQWTATVAQALLHPELAD